MRFRVLFATAMVGLTVSLQPQSVRTASAQEADGGGPGGPGGGGPGGGGPGGAPGGGGADSKTRLDAVLSVLRDHQREAGKACLDAMTEVHQTEDQVASLTQPDTGSARTDSSADIARDVLDSDYDTAQTACLPDAQRACSADPGDRNCARLGGSGPGPGPGPRPGG